LANARTSTPPPPFPAALGGEDADGEVVDDEGDDTDARSRFIFCFLTTTKEDHEPNPEITGKEKRNKYCIENWIILFEK
jgi:hypothetical protein